MESVQHGESKTTRHEELWQTLVDHLLSVIDTTGTSPWQKLLAVDRAGLLHSMHGKIIRGHDLAQLFKQLPTTVKTELHTRTQWPDVEF